MNSLRNLRIGGLAGVVGLVCIVLALPLGMGGGWLLALGGSPYYLAAALAFLLTGLLLLRRSPSALWAYAALLLGTLVWALVEAGLDWWALVARLDIPFAIGAVMMLPWLTRRLGRSTIAMSERTKHEQHSVSLVRGSGLALTVAMSAVAVVSVISLFLDPHDVGGSLPPSQGALIAQGESTLGVPPGEWHAYGRTGFGQRYSPLDQINVRTVADLAVAWQFHTGDLRGQPGDPVETTDEVTPLKVGERLFLCTPHQDVIALDATTGAEIWRHKSRIQTGLALQHLTCRGLSYQPPHAVASLAAASAPRSPDAATSGVATALASSGQATQPVAAGAGSAATTCDAKLFMPTADGRLIALDPRSGAVCADFGHGSGQIDLWAGMPNLRPGSYYSTSPVVVTAHLVIVGGTVLDNVSTHEQSGVVRAFDVDTGVLVWNWDSGHPDRTTPLPPGQKYTVNSPNSWSISSVDEKLGMVYVPMGNQPPDQWGGNRSPAVEKYSSSVVALDLATGAVRWVFQTVHHDLWDYDVPAQPSLVDLIIDGTVVPSLVQPTKQGELFVLDRRTGKPVRPVQEVAAPQGAAQGDHAAPTQPKAALSYDPPRLVGADMWGATMLDQLACRVAFHRLRYEGRFTPPSTQGSLIYPGNFGVFNWGSVAIDPRRQVAFTTPVHLAFVSQLKPRPDDTTLVVNDKPPTGSLPALNENFGAPFAIELHPFVSPLGIPCQAPPWGYVSGADLTSGKIVWQHRNGTVRDLSPLPLPFKMGVPDLGGPIVTAGGVAFLSGTLDYFVRAYDLTDGRQLWESRLPAGGQATPMTYLGADGRQFLLVVAGGHGSTHTKAGDSVIAYALPRSKP